MEVMGTISAGGFSKVALLAEQPAGRPRRGADRGPAAPAGARPPAARPTRSGAAAAAAGRAITGGAATGPSVTMTTDAGTGPWVSR